MNAFENLIKYALDAGHTISVFDGEEWDLKNSTDAKEIKAAIESVDEAQMIIRDSAGKKLGWARVSAYGLDPEETVIDNTITPFMEAWEAQQEDQNVEVEGNRP